MINNLLETGTLFNYKDVDFVHKMERLFGEKNEANDPAIMVGERDIPARDERYIEQSFEEED